MSEMLSKTPSTTTKERKEACRGQNAGAARRGHGMRFAYIRTTRLDWPAQLGWLLAKGSQWGLQRRDMLGQQCVFANQQRHEKRNR